MDAKVTYKKTFSLCEQLIQANTHDFTRGRLYERIKIFPIQRKIGDFHKNIYIQRIEKLAYHRSYYKILGKHHVAEVGQKSFESAPDDISTCSDYDKWFRFEPDGQLQNELLKKIKPYPWKVTVLIASEKKSM